VPKNKTTPLSMSTKKCPIIILLLFEVYKKQTTNKIEMELIAIAAIISGDAFEQTFHCCQFFSKKHC